MARIFIAADWLIQILNQEVWQFCLVPEFLKIEQKLAVPDQDEKIEVFFKMFHFHVLMQK